MSAPGSIDLEAKRPLPAFDVRLEWTLLAVMEESRIMPGFVKQSVVECHSNHGIEVTLGVSQRCRIVAILVVRVRVEYSTSLESGGMKFPSSSLMDAPVLGVRLRNAVDRSRVIQVTYLILW